MDGQHRLWAVFLSGVTVPMRVFFNEPAQSLEAIDAGQTRSNDQIITLAGGVGAVGRQLLKFLIDAAHGVRGRPEAREKYVKAERALQAYLAGEQLGRLYASTAELFPLPDRDSNVVAA